MHRANLSRLVVSALLCFVTAAGLAGGLASSVPAERHIPRVIYQTWVSKIVPIGIQIVRSRMLSRNPGYKVIMFDDADIDAYVSKHYSGSDTERAFRKLAGAARADLWRYLVLYNNGGVYLDLDSEIVVSLDELIKDDDTAIITREGTRHFMVQWMLIFGPRHPILKRVIELSVRSILDGPQVPEGVTLSIDSYQYHPILYQAGPPIFNRAVDDVVRSQLGKVPPWNVWDTPDAEVNSPLHAATGTRLLGIDYNGAARFKHEYVDEMLWFNPHWRNNEGKWSGVAITLILVAVVVLAIVAVLGGTRKGRAAAAIALRMWLVRSVLAPTAGCIVVCAVLWWLLIRGFISVF